MTTKIIESGDNGRLALQETTLSDGSKVYNVFLRGVSLPCIRQAVAEKPYNHLKDMIDKFEII